ncbi:MAG: ABC transporter permease [Planctomycetes bacterium]|nr:ABC transporter permease [Planctomycetota bacterium]
MPATPSSDPPARESAPPSAGTAAARLEEADAPAAPPDTADHTWLQHLGMPFYFRHTPRPAMRRGIFWGAFISIAVLLVLNLIFMPYGRDSMAYAIRFALFGNESGYRTFDAGARGIFNQFYIIALVLSGIIAPLFATFSLSNERVLGTMEFLKLAPLSTTGIVLGKMFGSVYVIHMISGALLLAGVPLAILGGYPPENVAIALAGMVMACLLLTAAGAFLATQTMAFRGFAAVAGLLALGFFVHVPPLAASGEKEVGFISLFSPWGMLDALFWHEFGSAWRRANVPMLAGSTYLAYAYVLAYQALFFVLFVWAASRKLDSSEKTALRPSAWIALWSFVAVGALGAAYNADVNNIRSLDHCWAAAMAILLVAGYVVCGLALIDHPFRRERTLSDECERLAGRGERASRRRFPLHAGFVTLLVLLTGGLGTAFFYETSTANRAEGWLLCAMIFLPALLFLLLALALEASAIRFRNFVGQATLSAVLSALLLGLTLAPAIHAGTINARFNRCAWAAENYYRWVANDKPKQQYYWNPSEQLELLNRHLENAEMLAEMDSLEKVQNIQRIYQNRPVALFLHFRPWAYLLYPLLFLAAFAGLYYWRHCAFALLRKEAERAVLPAAGVLYNKSDP